ncbi:MAG: auxin efflux carrier [Linnemannia elongata]|nr:MAG: auxin efflux carrier [Linnemannia elongata]
MGIDWFALAEAAAEGLSKINLYFLTPCLIFTKIASALSWDRFVTFWPIPLFYSVFLIVNFSVAQIGSKLLRLTREETRFATASIMFFNNNSLPIALVQSLALSGAVKLLFRDENDTAEAVLARGVSYILFTSVFDNLVRWSFGLNLLSHHKGDETNGKDDGSTSNNDNSTGPVRISSNEQGDVVIDVDSHPAPHTILLPTATPRTWISRLVAILKKARGLLQPPLVTAIVALIVGLIRPLHHILMDPDSKVFIFLIRPLDTCGRAAVPMILLCLGAQVLSFDNNPEEKSNPNNPVPFILFCRMFLSPLITLPAILLVPNSLSPALLGDPIFRLTMVMLSASPTAVNMMQICQINGFFEKKMARLLFWSYCVVGVPGILVWVMVALQAATWGS